MAELTYRDAVAYGIAQEMRRDPNVVFVGEDELSYTATEKVKFADARRVAAQYIAAEDSDWARHLRGAHADLLAEPTGAAS